MESNEGIELDTKPRRGNFAMFSESLWPRGLAQLIPGVMDRMLL